MWTGTDGRRRGASACTGKFFVALAAALLALGVAAGCAFVMGPGEPVGGGGNLHISLAGEAPARGRSITSGADLPTDVLAALVYDLVLTGPGGTVLRESVSGGQTLSLSVVTGNWRIDARAYQEKALAGTGSIAFYVKQGSNTVMVPMSMSGPCYEIRPGTVTGGTVQASFSAAFAGTTITLSAEAEQERALKPGSFQYNSMPVSGDSFTMPASDIVVGAEFVTFIRYVRAGAGGSGSSWTDASGDVQKIMDELAALRSVTGFTGPSVVKLGAGTYKPEWEPMIPARPGDPFVWKAPGDPRDAAFILRPGVQVWGGYPASGGSDGGRNPAANTATLSGDIGASGNNADNAYHVVLAVKIPADSGTVLDGLTIRGGNADGRSLLVMNNVLVLQHDGGGMDILSSSPVLVNIVISGNNALGLGGGMSTTGNSSPVLVNVVISGNTSGNGYGSGAGGMSNMRTSPILVNVVISGNRGHTHSGGMYNDSCSPVLVNTVITGNSADGRSGMYNMFDASPVVRNCIIWGNKDGSGIDNDFATPLITHSIVQGSGGSGSWVSRTGTNGGGNLDTDPRFVSASDFHLQSGSPAIDKGDDDLYPADAGDIEALMGGSTLSAEAKAAINAALQKDPGGAPRYRGEIDMGAYERQ